MHLRLLTLIGLVLVGGLQVRAQNSDDQDAPKRTREELADLLGPIALYPDPLISLILPASTVPSDIVLANRFVKAGSNPDEAEEKPWDSSVKALVRYPDTLSWLDENLEWTTQVGDAFVDQPVDVMEAIQALRAKARDMGNLVDTPQQRIVQDDSAIRIVPAEPEYIYEPSYDPQVVYYQRPVAEPLLYFGAPLIVGRWLGYDFDWHRHRLYRGDWHSGWDYRRDYDRNHDRDRDRGRDDRRENIYVNNSLTNVQAWHVDAKRHMAQARKPQSSSRPSGDRPGERPRPVVVLKPTPLSNHIKHGDGRRNEGPGKGETVRRGEPMGDGRRGDGVKGPDRRFDDPRKGETVRRGEAVGDGRPGDGMNRPGEKGGKGKVLVPKTPPPGVNGDGRKDFIDRNHDGRPDSKGDMVKPKGGNDDRKGIIDRNHDGRPDSKGDMVKPKGGNDDRKGIIDRNGDGRPDSKGDVSKPKGFPDRNGDGRPDFKKEPSTHTDMPKPKAKSDNPRPSNDGPKPKSDNPKPHTDSPKPKGDSPKPRGDAPKPKGDSPKPRGDAPKPKGDSPKPRGDAPKPKGDSPKPHTDAPKPKSAPAPAASKPAPSKPQGHSDGDGKKKDKDKDRKN